MFGYVYDVPPYLLYFVTWPLSNRKLNTTCVRCPYSKWRQRRSHLTSSRVYHVVVIASAERDGTRAETRFRLSPKRTSPFKSVGASVQSTAGSRGVRISFSNAGYTTFGAGVRALATHSILQFPLHFPSRASPCATRFRTSSTNYMTLDWSNFCCTPIAKQSYEVNSFKNRR